MGDICRLCEGPHATQHHGARDPAEETPPPQRTPRLVDCKACGELHPMGWPCEDEEDRA